MKPHTRSSRCFAAYCIGVLICLVLPALSQFSLDLLFGVSFFSRNLLIELPLEPNKSRTSPFLTPAPRGPLMLELEMTMDPSDLGTTGVDAIQTPFKWSFRFYDPEGKQPYLGVTLPVRALSRGSTQQTLEDGMIRITARELLHRHIPADRLRLEAKLHAALGQFLQNPVIRVYDQVDAKPIRLTLLFSILLTVTGPLLLVGAFCWYLVRSHSLQRISENSSEPL